MENSLWLLFSFAPAYSVVVSKIGILLPNNKFLATSTARSSKKLFSSNQPHFTLNTTSMYTLSPEETMK